MRKPRSLTGIKRPDVGLMNRIAELEARLATVEADDRVPAALARLTKLGADVEKAVQDFKKPK